MAERVVVLQSNRFETHFWVRAPDNSPSVEYLPVEQIYALTPGGMLLASLGSCTATLLHTYAQHHGLDLQEVEVRLQYGHGAGERHGRNGMVKGRIEEEIALSGGLKPDEHHKLLSVAQRCSVHKMLDRGIAVRYWLEDNHADD